MMNTRKNRISLCLILAVTGLLVGGSNWIAREPAHEADALLATPDERNEKELSAEIKLFEDLLSNSPPIAHAALQQIDESWEPSYAIMLIEINRFIAGFSPELANRVFEILARKTGQDFKTDHRDWLRWVWVEKLDLHPEYASFKANLYRRFDSRFVEYFNGSPASTIRLEEIQWGGVKRDGIPPLKNPNVISATQATWMDKNDTVFGVEVNGESRAYPKRILAWHEMANDTIGGESLCCVYCTLCGSMIVYQTEVNGEHYDLGTSGFLYRSNKLMYDHKTKSMWSTLSGQPVVGPLVGKEIKLNRLSVVTTTWDEWKTRHPETTVVSLNTGHHRDYREGAAYRQYFATDELMFDVSLRSDELNNKDSVFALRTETPKPDQLAISATFLSKHLVYHDHIGEQKIVIITEPQGASRAYYCEEITFKEFDKKSTVFDNEGKSWNLTEDSLQSEGEQVLKRVPSHHAFWFGWYAAFPETRLVQ